MARFPRLIDAAVLRAAASPHETHCMRVELKGVPSNVPYRLAGKGIQRYLLEYNAECHAHILDVPASVWMADREQIARDLLGGPHSSKVVVLSTPWSKTPTPVADETPEDIEIPEEETEDYRSPEQKAIDALASDEDPED